jgi:transposase
MRRRGSKKAGCAVAAPILTTRTTCCGKGALYQDLGANDFHRNDRAAQTNRLVKRLRNLGYPVELSTLAA